MTSGSIVKSGIEPASNFRLMRLDLIRHEKRKPIKKMNLLGLSAGFRTTFREFAPPD